MIDILCTLFILGLLLVLVVIMGLVAVDMGFNLWKDIQKRRNSHD